MTLLVGSLAYAVIVLMVGCRLATLTAWHFAMDKYEQEQRRYPSLYRGEKPPSSPNGDQWFGAAVLATGAAAVWPAVLLLFVFRGFLFAPPSDVKVRRQQERIDALEKELSLR